MSVHCDFRLIKINRKIRTVKGGDCNIFVPQKLYAKYRNLKASVASSALKRGQKFEIEGREAKYEPQTVNCKGFAR